MIPANSTIRPLRQQPKFQGSPLTTLLQGAPFWKRGLVKLIDMKESSQGISHVNFFKDTASVWFPKVLVARSNAERFEMTFMEFVESALFYYSGGLVGQHVFQHLFHWLSKDKGEITKNLIAKPLAELEKSHPAKLVAKVIPVKAATIIASIFGVAAVGEYGLNFAKNLLTEHFFKKSDFTDVINLTKGELKTQEQTAAAKKAHRRIAQSLTLAAGLIVAAAGVARYGGRNPKLLGALKKLVSLFDYNYGKKVVNGIEKVSFGLGKNQMRLIIAAGACVGYLDAARSNLEFWEIFTRVPMFVAPYLAYGSELLEGLMVKLVGKSFPEILKADYLKNPENYKLMKLSDQVKSSTDIAKELESGILSSSKGLKAVSGKLIVFFVPLLFGILGVGLGTTLLSQFWTKIRFNRAQREKQQQQQQQPSPVFQTVTPPPIKLQALPPQPQHHPVVSGIPAVSSGISYGPAPTFQYAYAAPTGRPRHTQQLSSFSLPQQA